MVDSVYETHAVAEKRRQEIAQAIVNVLDEVPDRYLAEPLDVDHIQQHVLALIHPHRNRLADLVGEVYSTKALETLWGVTREAVSKRFRKGNLFALKVGGQNFFPLFQFDGGEVRDDVMDVIQILRSAGDPWTIAAWLRTPSADDPEDRTPLELLDAGQASRVADEARDMARRWAA